MKPIIGWVAGIDLADLGRASAGVYDGTSRKKTETQAVVLHATLPKNNMASIGIVNLFTQGNGDEITFDSKGYYAAVEL